MKLMNQSRQGMAHSSEDSSIQETTEEDFDTFRQLVLDYCHEYGVDGWDMNFQHVHLPYEYANLSAVDSERTAIFSLSTEWDGGCKQLEEDAIDYVAEHESIHLLLWHFYSLAVNRFATEDEIGTEFERVTYQIQRILRNQRKWPEVRGR